MFVDLEFQDLGFRVFDLGFQDLVFRVSGFWV